LGGSEFAGQFEEVCKMERITLHVNKPRCPKMNGYVEKCHRTMREEFYQARDYLPLTVHEIRKYLELDDYYYNYIRPHASLKNKPPMLNIKKGSKKEPPSLTQK
jgi:putative transposase